MAKSKNVLFIDNEPLNISTAEKAFRDLKQVHLDVLQFEELPEIDDLIFNQYDLIFFKDPTSTFSLVKKLKMKLSKKDLPIVLIVDLGQDERFYNLMELQNIEIISEPVHINQIRFRFLSMVKSFEYRQELEKLVSHLEEEISLKSKSLLNQERDNAILAMIATYNHELNNPLTIAMGCLGKKYEQFNEKKYLTTVESLNRIMLVLKEIKELEKSHDINLKDYISGGPKMIDFKKK